MTSSSPEQPPTEAPPAPPAPADVPEPDAPPAPLYWYSGPTAWDDDPEHRWHKECPILANEHDGQIWSDSFENLTCMACGAFEAGPADIQPGAYRG